jgi:sorting nexin-1/2
LEGLNDDGSKLQITRKYSDFYALREALVRRWPGLFLPPVPEISYIGVNEKQISKNKQFLVNKFLNKILEKEFLASGEELKIFLTTAENEVEKTLNKLKPRSLEDLYGVYKSSFPHIFKEADEEVK